MLLVIDAGNTNIVFAIFDGDKLVGEWRASSDAKRTADELGVWILNLMERDHLDPKDIDASIIATVVPEVISILKIFCHKYFQTVPTIIGESNLDIGVKVLVEEPDEVGSDRIVNAVSAHETYGGPLVVIDFGTATTFDVVDKKGAYFGGIIAPGINLSVDALHLAAAKLPRVAVQKPAHVIGKRTVTAMMSGIYWGYIGLIEGLLRRIKDEYEEDMKVIVTGGLAPLFFDELDGVDHLDPKLTLRGLLNIYKRNN